MTGVIILVLVLSLSFLCLRLLLSPKWPVHKHYPALEHAIMNRPRALLESDSSAPQHHEPESDYTIAFDHIDRLGFMTYIVRVTRTNMNLLPEGVTCGMFSPVPIQKNNNDPNYTETDLVVLAERFSIHRQILIESMFTDDSARDLLARAKGQKGPKLREIQHDIHTGHVSFVFYLTAGQLGLEHGSTPEEFLEQAATAYNKSITAALAYRPRHEREVAQWASLFAALPFEQLHARSQILHHILTHHDRTPEISTMCRSILAHDVHIDQFTLFRHDPERFLDAIAPDMLKLFVRRYVKESEELLSGTEAITPKRLPEVFGAHLPFDVILDTQLPMVYRVKLVQWWLEHDTRDREALHEAIAAMSKRDQLQLRAALETDTGMSGALSSIDGQRGKLTVKEED